jgi:hypothetical protein
MPSDISPHLTIAGGDSHTDLDEKKDVTHVETGFNNDDEVVAKLSNKEGAIAAEQAEQQMTFREAIRDYKSAVFWSFGISLCIIMEGYDTALPVSCHGWHDDMFKDNPY